MNASENGTILNFIFGRIHIAANPPNNAGNTLLKAGVKTGFDRMGSNGSRNIKLTIIKRIC